MSCKLFGDRKSLTSTTLYGEGRASDTDFTAMAVSSIKIALVICGLATCVTRNLVSSDVVLSTADYFVTFDMMDTNSDGVLTITELDEVLTNIPEDDKRKYRRFYDGLDGNFDGLVQRDSMRTLVRFLDVNGNGVVEVNEALAEMSRIKESLAKEPRAVSKRNWGYQNEDS